MAGRRQGHHNVQPVQGHLSTLAGADVPDQGGVAKALGGVGVEDARAGGIAGASLKILPRQPVLGAGGTQGERQPGRQEDWNKQVGFAHGRSLLCQDYYFGKTPFAPHNARASSSASQWSAPRAPIYWSSRPVTRTSGGRRSHSAGMCSKAARTSRVSPGGNGPVGRTGEGRGAPMGRRVSRSTTMP